LLTKGNLPAIRTTLPTSIAPTTAAPNPVHEIPYSLRIIRFVNRIRRKAMRKKIVGGRISKKSFLIVLIASLDTLLLRDEKYNITL